ncbi:MAG: ATP-binding protein [Desulfovibrionaceae bacterium]|nr:ATP-binding protein [Desulfovibrionaceae bacterium]
MNIQTYPALRRRIFGVLLVMSLAPLAALGWFCIDRINALHADKISANLESVTRNKARVVDTFISERVAQIKNLTYTHPFEELTDAHRLSDIFNTMQANGKAFLDIGVIGRDGRHLTYVGPYDLADTNYSEAGWFHEVLRKGVYVSDVFLGFRNEPHFIIAVMRHAGSHTFIVRATIDLAAINQMVRRPYGGTRNDAFLINRDGLLQTKSLFHGDVMSRTTLELPDASFVPGSLVTSELEEDGVAYLAAVLELPMLPWRLVVLEDVKHALAPLHQLRVFVMLFVIGGALVVGLGAVLASRALVAHLEVLDRKQAQIDAQMIQSSKMAAMGKMATGVAHEINNPLTLIRESAGWMRDLLEEENPASMRNYAELSETAAKIENHVDRAKDITQRMLGFGRAVDPKQAELFVPTLLDQSIAFLETEARHRNIVVRREYDDAVTSIITDGAQLQQVFLNIIDNGLDAVGKDGVITVRAEAWNPGGGDRAGCRVLISDTGPGIPPDKIKRIFDPFFTTKKLGEGTGLGLAICHTILSSLGGAIHVESEVGKGSTFIITLPYEKA